MGNTLWINSELQCKTTTDNNFNSLIHIVLYPHEGGCVSTILPKLQPRNQVDVILGETYMHNLGIDHYRIIVQLNKLTHRSYRSNQTNSETPSRSTPPPVTSPRHGLGRAALETGTTSTYHRALRLLNPPWQTRIKPGGTSHIYTNECGGNTHNNKIWLRNP